MKELWSSLERKMQTRNCFLHLGNLKKTAKRYVIDAVAGMCMSLTLLLTRKGPNITIGTVIKISNSRIVLFHSMTVLG